MQREEAERQLAPYVRSIAQYSCVTKCDAQKLLGDKTFAVLLADKIRGVGPTEDTIYSWNVVDFLAEA